MALAGQRRAGFRLLRSTDGWDVQLDKLDSIKNGVDRLAPCFDPQPDVMRSCGF
jgi:hypothetical protein